MESFADNYKHIKGWGIDANPENEPTYPMKKYNGADHERLNYQRPEQQPVDMEILQSNERPNVTAVFGTSSPPSGVSGAIRRFAFKFSEGSAGHWFSLILADRINAIEGILDDIKRGHVPNIIAERGWTAEWKYNRKEFTKKIMIAAALTTFFAVVWSRSRKSRS